MLDQFSELPANHHPLECRRTSGCPVIAIAVVKPNIILQGNLWKRGVADVLDGQLSEFERECIAYAINEGNELAGDLLDDNDRVQLSWSVKNAQRLLDDMNE